MAARAMESAVLILVGWQADGYLDKLYRHKQRRLHQLLANFSPHPTQSISTALRNMFDQLLCYPLG